ncbi:hypothetical protein [Luteolibacter pohnpeiensis]|nr:hypothetical protein [Luteolibacter pohnpeiensis]
MRLCLFGACFILPQLKERLCDLVGELVQNLTIDYEAGSGLIAA